MVPARRPNRSTPHRQPKSKKETFVRAKVYVIPKHGVLDPAGKAIERALHSLGFTEAHDIRLGKYIEMQVEGDANHVAGRLDDMCRRLLANGVIEDFRFEVGD
jgi:phosphoribosylformylglycinamidine synthase subunit PurS